ncbi:MAG: penicillin-binding protein 2 [Dehalococcoidia bacterium]|nr:penicillin-binding protein 2 [Dehalococcoidia bacterium]
MMPVRQLLVAQSVTKYKLFHPLPRGEVVKGVSSLSGARLFTVSLLVTCATLAVAFRLFHIQIYQNKEYSQRANAEHLSEDVIPALRGVIRDRDGYPLAISTPGYDVVLDLNKSNGQTLSAEDLGTLSSVLKIEKTVLEARVKTNRSNVIFLAAAADYGAGQRITAAKLPGVKLVPTIKRDYPEGNIAATLLGFIGRDNVGLTGAEAAFQGEIGGIPGKLYFERDSLGDPIPMGYRKELSPTSGGDLTLTIDRFIQKVAEEELDKSIEKNRADGGTVIVMDPHSGEVLAMASKPSFSLEKLDILDQGNAELYRNRAITDLYEPGSTFKVFTIAAGLNEGLITHSTTYYDGGPINKYGITINTWNGAHYGTQDMTDLLVTSNNIGAVWVADKLGPDKFYNYVMRFGFKQPTNIGLSGEALGQVRTNKDPGWSPIDLAANSYGQGLNATPLQVVTAYSAIANGGVLMRPQIVKKIESDGITRETKPVEVARILDQKIIPELWAMMNESGERGSPPSKVAGFKIAGKTGTADIPSADGYTTGSTIGSFVGFIPYPDPKAVILVKIDNPRAAPWGSVVASPVFSAVSKRLLVHWKVQPTDLNSLAMDMTKRD